jgi:hypothetical protein
MEGGGAHVLRAFRLGFTQQYLDTALSQGIGGHHPGWAGAHDDDLSVLHSILHNIGEVVYRLRRVKLLGLRLHRLSVH